MLDAFKTKLNSIEPIKQELLDKAQKHLDFLTKPPGSLGRLEEIAARYCAIHETQYPAIHKKAIYTFAADHGITEEGVSAFPSSVTPQMVLNFIGGGAAVNVLARTVNATVKVVDIGVDHDFEKVKGLIHKKVRNGSGNFLKEDAMSENELLQALETGFSLALDAKKNNTDLIGTGDMGIGNTTPSSAIYSALLNLPVQTTTGKGTGIDNKALEHKVKVIQDALEFHKNELSDPYSVLQKVGGLEIAGICGLILGAASVRIPVIVDGFISGAAACVAMQMNSQVKDYLFFSHLSAEQGHQAVMQAMDISPLLSLDMRLGEGTGAAIAMGLFDAAINIYNEMATFASAGVDGKND